MNKYQKKKLYKLNNTPMTNLRRRIIDKHYYTMDIHLYVIQGCS